MVHTRELILDSAKVSCETFYWLKKLFEHLKQGLMIFLIRSHQFSSGMFLEFEFRYHSLLVLGDFTSRFQVNCQSISSIHRFGVDSRSTVARSIHFSTWSSDILLQSSLNSFRNSSRRLRPNLSMFRV
jgi:hypothetical protein